MVKNGHFLKTQNTLNTLHHEVFATGSEAEKNLTRLLRALRLPFGLPFGREHFVVEQIEQIIF